MQNVVAISLAVLFRKRHTSKYKVTNSTYRRQYEMTRSLHFVVDAAMWGGGLPVPGHNNISGSIPCLFGNTRFVPLVNI